MENSRIHKELLRRQPSTLDKFSMDLEMGQPVFVKEVYGNVWKTGIINQPALELDSYWIKFPDSLILRRIRSMIKPRSLPSHFKLKAEGDEWKHAGTLHSSDSFMPQNVDSNLPVAPMVSVTPPATKDRVRTHTPPIIPISYTGAPQPSITSSESGISSAFPGSPRCSTHSTKGVPPVRFTQTKK